MGAKTFLAFDLGASSGRSIVGEIRDGKLVLTETHRFPNGPVDKSGSLFWDFDSLKKNIVEGFEKSVKKFPEISSAAVDTWGVDYVFVKEDGSFVRPPYHYRDSRTEKMPAEVYGKMSEKDIYSIAGIQHMALNTIFQLAAHLKQHPEDFKGTKIMLVPDALTYLLCGKISCEYTDASTTQLLDAEKRSWSFEIIKKLGIPEDVFPAVSEPCSNAGTLLPELQQKFACKPVEICHVGSHDTASAFASVPVREGETSIFISCGTWALLGTETKTPVLSEKARLASFTNEGGICGTIRLLTNIMGMWLLQETKRVWNMGEKKVSFNDIEKMALAATPLKYIVNPNDNIFFAPGDMPANVREFCKRTGQTGEVSDGATVRAIYDSLALCFRSKADKLRELTGTDYKRINIVGGGTQDRFLMQLVADCTGLPVTAGPVEATAAGNIIAQALAVGMIKSLAEGREIIRNSFKMEEFTPKAADKAAWDEAYSRYTKLQQ